MKTTFLSKCLTPLLLASAVFSNAVYADRLAKVTGGGQFTFGGTDTTTIINARQLDPDTYAAAGQLQAVVHTDAVIVIVHGIIDCLRVEDNVAWTSGIITRGEVRLRGTQEVIDEFSGETFVNGVEDNGKPNSGTPDARTGVFTSSEFVNADDVTCTNQDLPEVDLTSGPTVLEFDSLLTSGNISVH